MKAKISNYLKLLKDVLLFASKFLCNVFRFIESNITHEEIYLVATCGWRSDDLHYMTFDNL